MHASASSFVQGRAMPAQTRTVVCQRSTAVVQMRYRGKGGDFTVAESFKRSEADTGSPEYQVSRLSARVVQLTSHLQANRKDYSSRRGLEKILAQRKNLLKYLYNTDKDKYFEVIKANNIRDKMSVVEVTKA